MDFLLTPDGDLYIGPNGDVSPVDSVAQKIKIKLRWFEGEWRWNPDEGIPYFDILDKNVDTDYIENCIREKIFEVTEVTEVRDVTVSVDPKTRIAKVQFTAITDYETIKEEVKISV